MHVKHFFHGFIVGIATAFLYTFGTDGDGSYGLRFALGTGIVFGLLAMAFGERFWRWAEKWLP